MVARVHSHLLLLLAVAALLLPWWRRLLRLLRLPHVAARPQKLQKQTEICMVGVECCSNLNQH